MANNIESAGERGNRLLGFLKRFNKVSAAVLLGAGVVFNSEILLALGLIDVAQAWGWGRLEKWSQDRKSAKVGSVALAGAR